jgi:hypothetical protein
MADKKNWDDNLPKNKQYIKKFYKKSEDEIKQQEGEGKVKTEGK